MTEPDRSQYIDAIRAALYTHQRYFEDQSAQVVRVFSDEGDWELWGEAHAYQLVQDAHHVRWVERWGTQQILVLDIPRGRVRFIDAPPTWRRADDDSLLVDIPEKLLAELWTMAQQNRNMLSGRATSSQIRHYDRVLGETREILDNANQ